MHGDILPALAVQIRDRTTDVVWTQWAALGSGAVADRSAASVVDPEALVLTSLGLVEHEPQLASLLSWWAAHGSRLLSVQRVRNLAERYPESVRGRLREFGARARSAGDHRWKAVAGESSVAAGTASGGEPRLEGGASSLLRLRLGLGVGIKADLVGALIGADGWWTVRELSAATGYTPRAVRRAAEEMARGGWIAASPASPAEYRAKAARWLPLLGLDAPAPWRDWQRQFALCLAVDAWVGGGTWREQELGEAERAARRLVDGHRPAFKWSGVAVPPPVSRPGSEYIRAFEAALMQVTRRMADGV